MYSPRRFAVRMRSNTPFRGNTDRHITKKIKGIYCKFISAPCGNTCW